MMNTLQSPPIHRFSLAYRPFIQRTGPARLAKILIFRRILFLILVLGSTWVGGHMISTILSQQEVRPLKWAIICIFIVLFAWISITFWTGLIGFIMLMRGGDPLTDPGKNDQDTDEILSKTTTAIIVPVYNEDVPRVFARLQAMYESLTEIGQLEHFSFFVLSDTNQEPLYRQEEDAWVELCQRLGGSGRIFYRRRKIRIHQKSGNIGDFCRRWGTQYKYMIPLDADSLMSGQSMVNMVKIMEARRDIGILQTAPKGVNQESLISRINQFTSYAYGPLLLAGSHFLQLNDAGFWGHNAIVRLEPFMKFCALPKLPGSPPFGGEILSHDFIEAALMRRAGWSVRLAYDLEDSYEELPPNLLEELERDCRWCRGNIQHLRLMFMRGISFGHRFLFFNGNMFYFSAFLWFVLLVLMTVYAIIDYFHRPQYFPLQHSLFPDWPVQYRLLSMDLLMVTLVLLFLPKILSIIWIVLTGKGCLFGGLPRLSLSVLLETIFSIFMAPIRMFFHSWFVLASLSGEKFDWKKQSRSLKKITFLEACKAHWFGCVMALIWAIIAFEVNQTLFLWLSVIVVPLIFAIPVSMFTSYPQVGKFFRKSGVFLTPVEIHPPKVMVSINSVLIPA